MRKRIARWAVRSGFPAEGNPRSVRRATTLIEVLGTLSVLLVLAVSAVAILGSITDVGVQTRDARQGRASIERLADRIRSDVHQADSIVAPDAWPLELETDAGTIRYQWDPSTHSLHRTAIADQERKSVDRFLLPQRCDPRVSVDEEIITVVLWTDERTVAGSWVIEAQRK